MSNASGAGPLLPTFYGFVHNTMDGLVLFEACLSGKLHHVPRRPHDRERASLIKSGSIFIYEENASGIKRWTDGVAWSPSRILGNFLIYRELEKPFPPGEKKRAMKRKRTSLPGEPYPRRAGEGGDGETDGDALSAPMSPPSPQPPLPPGPSQAPASSSIGESKPEHLTAAAEQDKELERSLIGSLVDSYGFRPDGLVKKTMSISLGGVSHHMVSYYKVDDVKNNLLPRPLSDHRLQGMAVRHELYLKQNFRAPVEETEHYALDGHMNTQPQMMYAVGMGNPYGVRGGQYMGGGYPGMYSVHPNYGPPVSVPSWASHSVSAGPTPYGNHPGYGASPQSNYYKAPTHPEQKPDAGLGQQPQSHHQHHRSSHEMSYPGPGGGASGGSGGYSPPYSTSGQRHGSQTAPSNIIQPVYQTQGQQAQSSFNSMSAGGGSSSYSGPGSGGGLTSPTTNGQAAQQAQHSAGGYDGPGSSQPYAVRSPAQAYSAQSVPHSAIPASPHPSIKSPLSAASNSGNPNASSSSGGGSGLNSTGPNVHAQDHAAVSYRSSSYTMGGGQQSSHHHQHSTTQPDMGGLGISNPGAYSANSQSTGPGATVGPSHNFGYGVAPSPAFRPVSDMASTGHYGA